MIGVIYQAGRLTARVERLETWRTETLSAFDRLYDELRHIEGLISSGRRE